MVEILIRMKTQQALAYRVFTLGICLFLYFAPNYSFSQSALARHHAFEIDIDSSKPVAINLHYSENTIPDTSNGFVINIPIPPNILINTKDISITTKDGKDIEFYATPLLWWRNIHDNSSHSIRSLKVFINRPKSTQILDQILFHLNRSSSTQLNTKPSNIIEWRNKKIHLSKNDTSKLITINEPVVYAGLPAKWLGLCLLRTVSLPLNTNKKLKWFDEALINYSESIVNNINNTKPVTQDINLLNFEPWMYDLAATLFNVYASTGDVKWLVEAHEKAQIYAHFINEEGHFTLHKKGDIKLSYNLSLLTDFILTGDSSLLTKIENIAIFTSKWRENYSENTNFWTERHQAYSLMGALGAWEATGNKLFSTRAITVAQSSINQAKSPIPPWRAQGCILHSIKAHEGDADNRPICSPWMSSLLSEAMLRFYIHSGNVDALQFIYGLARFVSEYGIYIETESRHMKGMHLPWYLASKEVEYTDDGPWADREHACDVSGLLAKGYWAGKILEQSTHNIKDSLNKLLLTCEKTLNMHFRKSKLTGNKFWRASPPRKFNWWFGSTSDMTYFLMQ